MEGNTPLRDSTQLLLVVSENWDASSAKMFQFERARPGDGWRLVDSFPVSLGKNGLGWGRGLHGTNSSEGPVKREGDLRAPAGVFSLGTAFGEKPEGPASYPYLRVTADTVGVDDGHSKFYNQIVDQSTIAQPDWKSAERMLREDGLYRMGVFVNHNFPAPEPGLGSCIFLHIWRGEGKATVGCTAMSAADLSRILGWLRPDASPRLVQLPAAEYARLRESWRLPDTDATAQVQNSWGPVILMACLILSIGVLAFFKQRVKRFGRIASCSL